MASSGCRLRAGIVTATLVLIGLGGPPGALAGDGPDQPPTLAWADCGGGFECATITVPLDYGHAARGTLELPVIRMPAKDPARRLGTLFVNFGGPGDPTTQTLRAGGVAVFQGLNDRYDVLGWDLRGTGGTDAIDCKADLTRIGPLVQPFPRPETVDRDALTRQYGTFIERCVSLNPRILPYVTTGNTARDMDRIRRALGEDHIDFFGFSYGTFLGATYESLFPERVGRFVLDGALDPEEYVGDPIHSIRHQTKAFEVALGRFLQACAAHQDVCHGFGGDDPGSAYDELAERMDAQPLPAGAGDPRLVDGDDLLTASIMLLYAKQAWPVLADALASAAAGDGALVQFLVDVFYGRNADGTFDPSFDRFFAISSTEAAFPRDADAYFRMGAEDFDLFDHFWWNSGYFDLAQAMWPVRPKGLHAGPFRAPDGATATLVIGTTYDPATPYKGARRMATQLGNARLLTMRGDGHTAYFGNSQCIDTAVEAYLEDGTVPAAGTVCRQQVPFAGAPVQAMSGGETTGRRRPGTNVALRPHTKPLVSTTGR